jgi:excisionase family DNA binding protein
MDLIGELERELSKIAPAQCPGLLGELERLKALVWVHLNTQGGHGTGESFQPGNQLLTIPQVSERLALPVSRVYELARQGKLPVVKVGKYVESKPFNLRGGLGIIGTWHLTRSYPLRIMLVMAMKGSELRRYRAKMGLTLKGMADLVGLHWNSIARMERGEMTISEPVARLVRLLGTLQRKRKQGGK